MKKVVFLTGATGLVGSNLIPRILKEDAHSKLVVLVRGGSNGEARERLLKTLCFVSSELQNVDATERIEVVAGDVTLGNLGLPDSLYHELSANVTHVIHSAANVQFQQTIDEARRINVDGTRNLMTFALRAAATGQLQRVAYISTAYVSGKRTGKILENELDCNQEFGNNYEQSKFEAETYVQTLLNSLPVTIFRPSIIVGDSRTGHTTTFNVLYQPLRLIYRGLLRIVPGSRRTPLDVVPIDYVSDAICHIFLKTRQGIGETFHVTAGGDVATTSGEVVDLAVEYFNNISGNDRIPSIAFLPLSLFRSAKRFLHDRGKKVLQAMEVYVPYLCFSRTFDTRRTVCALSGTSIAPPRFFTYHKMILRYCLDVNWRTPVKTVG